MFVTIVIELSEIDAIVSIPLSGQYVCNLIRVDNINSVNELVSIPLSGQYVCNFLRVQKNTLKKKSQSPYRVNMFVTQTVMKAWIIKKSQSPYRVNMFVTILRNETVNYKVSQSPYRVNMFVTANFVEIQGFLKTLNFLKFT